MRVGCIHGRFQPFHNGHLSYALCALEKVDFIYVGITRVFADVDGVSNIRGGLHSDESNNNPFTYFQRSQLVEAGLLSAGVGLDRFRVIPFPIEQPKSLPFFCPRQIVCYTTIKDKWNEQKIEHLSSLKYNVSVIDNVERHDFEYASGTQIREWVRCGDPRWKKAVPEGVADLLEEWTGNVMDVDATLKGNNQR